MPSSHFSFAHLYPHFHLIGEREDVSTWEAQGPPGHHLIKISAKEEGLRREHDFLSQGNHRNFPRPVRFEKIGEKWILVREYVPGETLSKYFGKLSSLELGRIAAQMARALAALHFRGFAHGDLNGENVLLGENNRVFLIDFEFLKPRHQKAEKIQGTPATLAPELFWGSAPTIQSDLYSLGCLLYAMIAGHYPFQGPSLSALLRQHALETPPDPTLNRVDFPRPLGLLTLRLMAKNPGDRFAEANDFIREVNRTLSFQESLEPSPPRATDLERLRASKTSSIDRDAIDHLQKRKKLNSEERLTLAELLLKTERLEELKTLIPQLPETANRLFSGLLLNRRGRYREALASFRSEKGTQDPEAAMGVATALYYTGHRDKAVQSLQEAERLLEGSPQGQMALRNFQGNLFFFERRLEEAAEAFQRTLEAARQTGSASMEALSLMNLANVQTAQRDFGPALMNYEKASELYETLGLSLERAKTDLNAAGLLRFFGHLDKADTLIEKAESILEGNPNPQLLSYSLLLKADLEKKRGDFEQALRHLEEAQNRLKTDPSASDQGDLWVSRAEIYFAQGNAEKMCAALEKAEEISKRSEDRLLGGRIQLLIFLLPCLQKKSLVLTKILEKTRDLNLQGDLEFVLDNLKRGFLLTSSRGGTWPEEIKRSIREMAEETCQRLPPDFQPFFRRYYRELWEKADALSSLETPPSSLSPDPALLPSILEWVREITGELELHSLTEKILNRMLQFAGMERGFVILKEEERLTVTQSHRIRPEDFNPEGPEELSWSLTRQALERGAPLVTADAQNDRRFSLSQSVHALNLRAVMVLPFRFQGQTLGAVYLDSRLKAEHLVQTDLSYLSGLADILGLAIHNAAIFEKTEQDLNLAQEALRRSQEALDLKYRYENIIGRSEPTRRLLQKVDRVTEVRVPVLILGESGVGKELVARAIHHNGPLKKGPFLAANCAAIPESLVESEMFGHERGAFTGALESRPGLFEQAHRGTLFLDEIGDMPLTVQAKVLRVLQEGEIRRVGSTQSRKVEVRIIAATHRDLKEEIAGNRFREDLFYRLSVAEIRIPPLRERRDDIPWLVDHFLERFAEKNKTPRKKMDSSVMAILMQYDWPGNIRELENLIDTLCIFSSGRKIILEDLQQRPEFLKRGPEKKSTSPVSLLSAAIDRGEINLSEAKRRFERQEILRALSLNGNKVGETARHLGMPRPQLSRLLAYHRILRDGNKM
jgi:transcriptional regulator with GAF, ATPase, and Fis domain/serine/threonine protein kinase